MRVGVLAKGGTDWIGGRLYTINLIRALRSLPIEERPEVVLLTAGHDDTAAFSSLVDDVELQRLPDETREAGGSHDPSELLAATLAARHIDLIYPCMRSLGVGFATPWLPWVPDLQHRCRPELFSAAERQRRDRGFARLAADARRLVLSSHAARKDFDQFCPAHGHKLRVLPFTSVPTPDWFHGDPVATARRLGLPETYLIVCNQFWAHKNHRVAFEAVAILKDRGLDLHLVCTGQTRDPRDPHYMAELKRGIADRGLTDRIHILGLIPRLDQIQLLRQAAALLQPSLFEGWSTVVEDGRALGKPMFLSDIPVHREQQPDGAAYFDPHRAEALADRIEQRWDDLRHATVPANADGQVQRHRGRVVRFARRFMGIAGQLLDDYRRGRTPDNPAKPPQATEVRCRRPEMSIAPLRRDDSSRGPRR